MKTTRHEALYPSAKQPFWAPTKTFARPVALETDGYVLSANPKSEEFNYMWQVNSDWNAYMDNNTRQIQPDVVVGDTVGGRITHDETDFVASSLAGYRLLFVSGVILTAARTLANQVNVEADSPDTSIELDTFDLTLVEVSGYLSLTTDTGKLILNGVTHALIVRGAVTVEEGPNFSGSYYHNGDFHSKAQDIQILSQPDMVVMTSAELAGYSEDPKFVKYNFATKLFETREGAARVPITGDWTIIKSIELMVGDLEFPATYNRPKIETDRHFQIPAGVGTYPFRIYVRGSGGECSFITDRTFAELIALQADVMPTTAEQKAQQYIKNRGEGNKILVNNQQIYSGDRPSEIESSVQIIHPYVFPNNGYSFHGVAESGVNDDETLLIDAWKAWGGIESLEIAPIHNPFASILLWYKLFMPDDAGYFTRPATHFGGTGGVDPSIHSRTSPNGFETLTSGNYTSAAEAIIKGISDVDIKKFKVWARVYDAGLSIPQETSGTPKTTIASKIVHNGTDDNWIYLVDSETGSAVSVSATGTLTIDMGGNSGISVLQDAMQKTTGEVGTSSTAGFVDTTPLATGVFSKGSNVANGFTIVGGTRSTLLFDNSGSTSPNAAKTNDDETRVKSVQNFKYTLP